MVMCGFLVSSLWSKTCILGSLASLNFPNGVNEYLSFKQPHDELVTCPRCTPSFAEMVPCKPEQDQAAIENEQTSLCSTLSLVGLCRNTSKNRRSLLFPSKVHTFAHKEEIRAAYWEINKEQAE